MSQEKIYREIICEMWNTKFDMILIEEKNLFCKK